MNDNNNLSVSVIPATKRWVQNGGQFKMQTNIRVAAYCRVSTGDESQQTSYTKQKEFYDELIRNKDGWEFAGIYADEAISGTSRVHRVEFNRMMEDAKAGKLDYIVTKSISRFARNTVDTLDCVRELRKQNPPVGIYFEKENIDTLDATGELILTILSALAQDESRSISDNIRWTFQKNFQAGIPRINLSRMLGYDKGEKGEWVINEEQAKIVRYIFDNFISGKSAHKVAQELNDLGYRTVNGNIWRTDGVLDILRNEKFVGDLEMQKTVTKDYLSHYSVINRGEAPKYYVENHHKPIIDHITWDKAQALLYKKSRKNTSQQEKHPRIGSSPFTNLVCGKTLEDGTICGNKFFRQTYTGAASGYTDNRSLEATGGDKSIYLEKYSYSFPVWRCKRKLEKDKPSCHSEVLHECALEQSFMETLYRMKSDYEENGGNSQIYILFQNAYEQTYQSLRANSVIIQRMELMDEQINKIEGELQKNIIKQRDAIGEEEKAYADIVKDMQQRLVELKVQRSSMQEEQEVLSTMQKKFNFFIECLKGLPIIRENDFIHFERSIYCAFIEKGVVNGDEVEYTTNFGVKLTTYGNRRTLKSFVGYRRIKDDGTTEILDAPYKVCGTRIQYRRYPRKQVKGE